jgi:hypothetical protein
MTEKQKKILLKGRLNGSQRNKVKSLLDMMYTPRELSEEIGISKQQIHRVYLPLGCPHTRDRIGHILINGEAFRDWVISLYQKQKLKPNEAFCVSCKAIVEMVDPQIICKGDLVYQLSNCDTCGNKVARIISSKRKKNDKQGELEAH